MAPEFRKIGTVERTNITWGQIGGLREVKRKIIESVELPYKHKALFAKYGKAPTKGILLYGPPGCGKTLIGKAISTSVARLWNKGADGGFIYVKAPEMLDKYIGNSESSVRDLFARAREFKRVYGCPATIFLDEADGVLSKRGKDDTALGGMRDTLVATFLTEMDGMQESGALVVMATNRPDNLDPAVIREGRIDQKVYIPRPNFEEACAIFNVHLATRPIVATEKRRYFGKKFAELLFNDRVTLYNVHTKKGHVEKFRLNHLASGALIAMLVDHATTYAIRREIRGKGLTASGLSLLDAEKAVQDVYTQNLTLEHAEELRDFVKDLGDEVAGVERPRLQVAC